MGTPTTGIVPDPGARKLLPLPAKDVAAKLALLPHWLGLCVKSVKASKNCGRVPISEAKLLYCV